MTRRAAHLVTAAAVTAAVIGGATPALAAPPVIDRVVLDEQNVPEDAFACGFPVFVSFSGRVTFRHFADDGTGVVQVVTANISVVLTGDPDRDGDVDTSLRVRNVGADVTRVTPDGDVILTVVGQVPFPGDVPYAYKGALRIDLGTDEVVLEPQNTTSVAELCAALGPDVP